MKNYYVFKGQNDTCGAPNRLTGLMSVHGDIIAFSTKEKRDRYYNEYYSQNNPSEFVRKCNKFTARSYCLGQSTYSFSDYMKYVDMNADEHYESYFRVAS